MRILIKNVQLNRHPVDIFIDGRFIVRVGNDLYEEAERVIDGSGKAVVPGFVNGHTHSAMTLFRGFGDDLPLEKWLNEKIWPYEKHLSEEDVYWGTKLACVEMIKTGTTCFNDMYMHYPPVLRAVEEMGLRAVLGSTVFDFFRDDIAGQARQQVAKDSVLPRSGRISFSLAPHAIYTVSGATLRWVDDSAKANGWLVHLHLAETQTEYNNSVKNFGLSPVRYLNRLKLLSPRLILAHCLYVDEEEIRMLADHGVRVVHNPNSNLKLGSGHAFKYREMKAAGILTAIGTDGAATSNNLNMLEAAKIAALLQKGWRNDPTVMPAGEALQCITENGAAILNIHAGKIEAGYLADLCLIDLRSSAFTPGFNFVSNLIYATYGNCVDTVICDGNILMENRSLKGEDEIVEQAGKTADKLIKNHG
ncbi:MAG: amidohydrolase [Bacteroidales bacterium]|jgi:5-methylthioadenosine/S-adenosylhomocysteine deaminase|nr:amidohydrolase [Bacteroidales bacterium]